MPKGTDYINNLTSYLKKNVKKGYPLDSLKWALINQGHSKIEIEKAIKIVQDELVHEAPVLETKPEIKYELVEPQAEKKPWWKRLLGL